jgi:hypothetical protein
LLWNFLAGFACIVAAVYFVFAFPAHGGAKAEDAQPASANEKSV